MRNGRVVTATRAQMHNVLHPRLLRVVQKSFTLPQHVHGIARQNKQAIDTFERRQVSTLIVEIQNDSCNSAVRKSNRFLRRTNRRHNLNVFLAA